MDKVIKALLNTKRSAEVGSSAEAPKSRYMGAGRYAAHQR